MLRRGGRQGNTYHRGNGLDGGFTDWRDKFHSVFIGNLSLRVSNTTLWGIFMLYGRVRDVFIGRNLNRTTTFAFVRYGTEMEARRAIQQGNNRVVDGRVIKVSSAVKRKQMQHKQTKEIREEPERSNASGSVRDGRSYATILMENGQANDKDQKKLNQGPKGVQIKEMVFTSHTTKATLKWLKRSAIGQLNGFIPPKSVQDSLAREGILVDVSTYGGLSVLVTFADKEEMEVMLRNYESIFLCWFQSIEPWDPATVHIDSFWWLSITGIPLQLWHEEFFKQIGEMWGSYVSTDSTTKQRYRLDQARIMVASKVQRTVPPELKVMVEGKQFILKIRVEPVYDFMAVFSDRKLPDWVVDTVVPLNASSSSFTDDRCEQWVADNSKNFEKEAMGMGEADRNNVSVDRGSTIGRWKNNGSEVKSSRQMDQGSTMGLSEDLFLSPVRMGPEPRRALEEAEMMGGPGSKNKITNSLCEGKEGHGYEEVKEDQRNLGPKEIQTMDSVRPYDGSSESFVPETNSITIKDSRDVEIIGHQKKKRGKKPKIKLLPGMIKKKGLKKSKTKEVEMASANKKAVELDGITISDGNIAHRNDRNWKEALAVWDFTEQMAVRFKGSKDELLRAAAEDDQA